MASDTPIQRPDGCEDSPRGFKAIAENRCDIQELGVTRHTPVVEQVISGRCLEARHFQSTLQHSTKLAKEVTLPAARLDRNLNKMGRVWN